MLGVSKKTVLRRRYELKEELDARIVSILSSSPNSGERMVIGALTARNIKVKRESVCINFSSRSSQWRRQRDK